MSMIGSDSRSADALRPPLIVHFGLSIHRLGQLIDAYHVARGIAERAVAYAVRLIRWLLDDLGTAGLHALEGAVHIRTAEHDGRVTALGHHLGDRAPLVVGEARVGGRRVQDDRRVRLVDRPDSDPAHAPV